MWLGTGSQPEHWKLVRAKKQRKCYLSKCGRQIDPGDKYWRLDDPDGPVRMCKECGDAERQRRDIPGIVARREQHRLATQKPGASNLADGFIIVFWAIVIVVLAYGFFFSGSGGGGARILDEGQRVYYPY